MFSLCRTVLEEGNLKDDLRNPRAGALVTFEGRVRNENEGRTVIRLDYEAYEALAEKEGLKIIEEASREFDILQAKCVHRVGCLQIGEMAVWIGVIAAHRAEAFRACQYILDEVKSRVPIWKKEHYSDGDSGWVHCQHRTAATACVPPAKTGDHASVGQASPASFSGQQ